MRRFCRRAGPRRHSRVLEVRRWADRRSIADWRRLGSREKSREARRGWRDLAGGETASVCANFETRSRIVILAYLQKVLARAVAQGVLLGCNRRGIPRWARADRPRR